MVRVQFGRYSSKGILGPGRRCNKNSPNLCAKTCKDPNLKIGYFSSTLLAATGGELAMAVVAVAAAAAIVIIVAVAFAAAAAGRS